ncbi:hypothetical protein FB451DRAFT_1561389 [Mycena latifolia]|nr:hypothetical protein FB451DRAFT_1561389 [Mycena latifolia]
MPGWRVGGGLGWSEARMRVSFWDDGAGGGVDALVLDLELGVIMGRDRGNELQLYAPGERNTHTCADAGEVRAAGAEGLCSEIPVLATLAMWMWRIRRRSWQTDGASWRGCLRARLDASPAVCASRFEGNAGFQWDANEDCIDEYCMNVRMFLTTPHALYIYSLARGRVVGVWAPRAPSPVPGSRGPRDAKEQEKAIGTPCAFEAARRFIVVTTHSPPTLVILAHHPRVSASAPSATLAPRPRTPITSLPSRPPHRHSPRSRSSRCRGASSRSYPPAASTPAHSLVAREPRVTVAFDIGRARAQSGVQDVLVFDPVDGVLSLRRVTVALEAARRC